jgi:surface antigen
MWHQAGILGKVESIDPFARSHNPCKQPIDFATTVRMGNHHSFGQGAHKKIALLRQVGSRSAMGRTKGGT